VVFEVADHGQIMFEFETLGHLMFEVETFGQFALPINLKISLSLKLIETLSKS